METTTIHPAEAYLRNAANPPYLYVRIEGKRGNRNGQCSKRSRRDTRFSCRFPARGKGRFTLLIR